MLHQVRLDFVGFCLVWVMLVTICFVEMCWLGYGWSAWIGLCYVKLIYVGSSFGVATLVIGLPASCKASRHSSSLYSHKQIDSGRRFIGVASYGISRLHFSWSTCFSKIRTFLARICISLIFVISLPRLLKHCTHLTWSERLWPLKELTLLISPKSWLKHVNEQVPRGDTAAPSDDCQDKQYWPVAQKQTWSIYTFLFSLQWNS